MAPAELIVQQFVCLLPSFLIFQVFADEALKFGIVDKVFETRPESEVGDGDGTGSGGAPD